MIDTPCEGYWSVHFRNLWYVSGLEVEISVTWKIELRQLSQLITNCSKKYVTKPSLDLKTFVFCAASLCSRGILFDVLPFLRFLTVEMFHSRVVCFRIMTLIFTDWEQTTFSCQWTALTRPGSATTREMDPRHLKTKVTCSFVFRQCLVCEHN